MILNHADAYNFATYNYICSDGRLVIQAKNLLVYACAILCHSVQYSRIGIMSKLNVEGEI